MKTIFLKPPYVTQLVDGQEYSEAEQKYLEAEKKFTVAGYDIIL